VQARLDTNHTAAYGWSDPENDLVSPPVKLRLPSADPIELALELEGEFMRARSIAEGRSPPVLRPDLPPGPLTDEFKAHWHEIDFVSPSLSAFWGRPMHIRGFVLTPPNYGTGKALYPTVYRASGFGASLETQKFQAISVYKLMKSAEEPPMIQVFLDHHSPWGTHEFADSVNNGPWGKALTRELIPALENQYRMDAKVSGRFVTGHSSGGWFAMWQQVAYPDVFGGAWASSPDPTDFRSFTGVDLYRDGANAYIRPDGKVQSLVRDTKGAEVQSLREYAQGESVLGDIGGQFDSFDWVFSPKGEDGRPQPVFDRATGLVDPVVAAYWREHFDISHILRRDWKTLKPKLDGKIHLTVGDIDTFHLNESAKLLQQELDKLGAKSTFNYVPGGTHFNTGMINGDANGLEKKFSWEMYAVARPGSKLKAPPAPPSPKPGQTPPG
jgi:S-formylglutathione hydrolase FrmB